MKRLFGFAFGWMFLLATAAVGPPLNAQQTDKVIMSSQAHAAGSFTAVLTQSNAIGNRAGATWAPNTAHFLLAQGAPPPWCTSRTCVEQYCSQNPCFVSPRKRIEKLAPQPHIALNWRRPELERQSQASGV